ncbi:MAG: T9SS type A sorting domain-containing protein [Janthinobacterium lividum]
MKIQYLTTWTVYLQRTCLFFWLCLPAPAALRAQTLLVQAASNNTLPLPDFGTIPVNRVSAPQAFLLSGTGLIDNVTVTAPDGFQVRVGTSAYASTIALVPAGGAVSPTSIDVIFAPVTSGTHPDGTGTYANPILATTPTSSSSVTQTVAVSGTAPSGPYVFTDTATLAFGQVSGSGSGQPLTFLVGGGNLGTTPITLTTALTGGTASGSIQLRNMAVAGSTFATSLLIAPVNGQVSQTTIQVRLVGPIASQSSFTGTITATSGAAVAAPSNVVQVTGTNSFVGSNSSSTFTVSTPPTTPATPGYPSGGQPLQPFSTVPEKASASQTLLVSGSFLINNIVVRAPANFQVALDAAFTGLGTGGAGTTTANSVAITPVNGMVANVLVYIRYVPLVAGTESGTASNFSSTPATPIATTVAANSIGTIESRTVFVKPNPLVIGTNVQSAPQLIRIHAELIRNPIRLSVSGESSGAQGNPNGYAQFRISTDGTTYTDPTSLSANYIQLTPDPTTNSIDQDIYVLYAPTRVGAAQAVLQYNTPDVTATPANTTTPVVSSFSGPTANQLRGTAIDTEPTRDTPFQAARNVGDASATITFQPDFNLSGYGEFHIVLISTSATLTVPDVMPQDGTDYNAGNGSFQGAGQSTLADGQGHLYYVVFAGGATAATITGLNAQTTYYAYVFDYNSTNLFDDNDSNQPGTVLINNAENYKGPAQSLVLGVALPGAAPLPVGLSAFTAQLEGPAVRVAWTTASEKNNASFTVERSVAGQAFTTVGTVPGAGTSNAAHTYAWLDTKLPAGGTLLYYRLHQVDVDGTNTYSPVRAVTLAKATTEASLQLVTYPNPAHEAVRVRLLGAGATTAPLEVFDALGRLLGTQAAPTDGREVVLPLAGWPAGLYVLRVGKLSQRLQVE